MNWIRQSLRYGFQLAEDAADVAFPRPWNPLYHLGALGFFMYWIVAVSGIYIYIFFDTGAVQGYQSVQYMTVDQWYLAGVMRSLHRYASDAMVLFMLIHIAREFSLDRYRGPRAFTWVTGVPILILVFAAGITGYWLVWDKLAQYVAIATTEWLDWLPIFGEPIARNFVAPDSLDDRFFTLLTFMHIAVPLILLGILWIHLNRLSKPEINPARGLSISMFLMLLAISFIKPATSQGPADLSTVAAVVHLDWFYLGLYPLLDYWTSGTVWGAAGALTLILVLLPWLPPLRRAPAAKVDLAHCNGCTWCAEDCPFNAITMRPRTDDAPFEQEAAVNPNLCVSCGICAGACPSATPFRRSGEIRTGIDLPHRPLDDLRQRIVSAGGALTGEARVLLFGCEYGARIGRLDGAGVAAVSLPCIANLPPSFIDFALSRGHADGVFLSGCRDCECHHRFGIAWTEQRVGRERDPRLRARIPRQRIGMLWAGPTGERQLRHAVETFRADLAGLEPAGVAGAAEGPPPDPGAAGAPLTRTGSDG